MLCKYCFNPIYAGYQDPIPADKDFWFVLSKGFRVFFSCNYFQGSLHYACNRLQTRLCRWFWNLLTIVWLNWWNNVSTGRWLLPLPNKTTNYGRFVPMRLQCNAMCLFQASVKSGSGSSFHWRVLERWSFTSTTSRHSTFSSRSFPISMTTIIVELKLCRTAAHWYQLHLTVFCALKALLPVWCLAQYMTSGATL